MTVAPDTSPPLESLTTPVTAGSASDSRQRTANSHIMCLSCLVGISRNTRRAPPAIIQRGTKRR